MNNDHLLDGNTSALNNHQNNEAIEDHRYEQFERDLESEIESSDPFREGIAQIRIAYQQWESYCRDNGYEPDDVRMMTEFQDDFLRLVGDMI